MAFSHLGTPSGHTAKKATYLQSNGVRLLDTYQKSVKRPKTLKKAFENWLSLLD